MNKPNAKICLSIIMWLLFHNVFCFAQAQQIFKKDFDSTSVVATFTKPKTVHLKVGVDNFTTKSDDKEKVLKYCEDFIIDALKKTYLGKLPEIQSFAEKRAEEIVAYRFSTSSVGEKEKISLNDDYNLIRTQPAPGEYIYYIDNKSRDSDVTTIFKKASGKYDFDIAAIEASPAKKVFIEKFGKIVGEIKKHVRLSPIHLLKTGEIFQLRFEISDGSYQYIGISNEQATALLGKELSSSGGSTVYDLKNAIGKTNDSKSTTSGSETKDLENVNSETFDKKVAHKDAIFAEKVYQLEFRKKNLKYYLKICGPAVDIVEAQGKKELRVSKDTCFSSTDSLSTLEENESGFKQMADNVVKKLNKFVDVTEEKYKAEITKAYYYFKSKEDQTVRDEKLEKEKQAFYKESYLKEISEEKDTTTIVGRITKSKKPIILYHADGTTEEVRLKSVKFSIEEGKFQKRMIIAVTEKGTFFNKDAPIPLIVLRDRANDILVSTDINNRDYITVGQIIEYTGSRFYPDDIDDVELTDDIPSKDLHAASNLNSIINFSLYTDLTGLLGRRPNGLLITDVTGKFITNTANFTNSGSSYLTYLEANLSFAKFDSKFRSLDSTNIKSGKNGIKDTIDRMYLNQVAWFKGSLKLNLLSLRFSPSQYLHVNTGAQINVVNADSLFKKEKDIIFFNYFPEAVYSIKRLKNFGMDVTFRFMFQRIADSAPFDNKKFETIFVPQVAFFYYPTRNSNNRIYLRFNYWDNVSDAQNNFYQLQFGWRTGLKLSK